MLNEGVHIEDVNGVIMLRATQSANVFYQQIGRAMACSEKSLHPVIFDIVNNFETGDTAKEYYAIMEISRDGASEDDDIEFELYDYVRDIRQILTELSETFENSWDIVYDTLVEFKQKYDRFPLSNENYDGFKLGQWCRNQRALYRQGNLSDDQVQKLNEIDFPWDLNELSWYSAYEEVKKIAEQLGKFPAKSEMSKELVAWVQAQRQKYRAGNLEENKARLLMDIGCQMKIKATAGWDDRFEELKDFVAKNGRFPENSDGFDDDSTKVLLTWINTQRRYYAKGTLSDDKIKALEAIGFVWNAIDKQWDDNYAVLKAFVDENGRLPTQNESYNGVQIGLWLNTQRRKVNSQSRIQLKDEQKEKLLALGVDLQTSAYMQKWMEHYTLYVEYKNLYRDEPKLKKRYKGKDIATWMYTQKMYLKTGKLSSDRVKLLEEIGVTESE